MPGQNRDRSRDSGLMNPTRPGPDKVSRPETRQFPTIPSPSLEGPDRRGRNVAFQDGTSTIMIGSDHGIVYAFDRCTGEVVDTIRIGVKDWVQSISVRFGPPVEEFC